jgi:predicted Na+-dependent transporter
VVSKPKPLIVFFLGSHVGMPLTPRAVASVFIPGDSAVVTGFVLLFSIPTAVVGYIWSSIYKGDGALSLSMILLDTILAPLVTPMTVRILTRTTVQIDTTGMMLSLIWMVVVPSIVGSMVNYLTKGRVNEHIGPALKPFAKIALLFVVAINVSRIAQDILDFDPSYVPIMLVRLLGVGIPARQARGEAVRHRRTEDGQRDIRHRATEHQRRARARHLVLSSEGGDSRHIRNRVPADGLRNDRTETVRGEAPDSNQ